MTAKAEKSGEPDKVYTAMDLVDKTLPEIIDLMGGEFDVEGESAVGGVIIYICNNNVMPDIKFQIEQTDFMEMMKYAADFGKNNGFSQSVVNEIKDKCKAGDSPFLIYLSGNAHLNKTITADMTYNQIAAASGLDLSGFATRDTNVGVSYNGGAIWFEYYSSDFKTKPGLNDDVSVDVLKENDPRLWYIDVMPQGYNGREHDYGVFDDRNEETPQNDSVYSWYVEPSVEADNMTPFFIYNDVQSSGNLDRMSLLECTPYKKDGKWGLADYMGNKVYDPICDEIMINSNEDMVSVDNSNIFNNQVLVYDNGRISTKKSMFELGTAGRGQREYYWVEEEHQLYIKSGVQSAVPTTVNGTVAAQLAHIIDFGSGSITVQSENDRAVNEQNPDIVLVKNGVLLNDTYYTDAGSNVAVDGELIAVKKDGIWGYVNENGETVIPFEYSATEIIYYTLPISEEYSHSIPFEASNGYLSLCKDGSYLLCDLDGNVVIPEGTFEKILPVYEKDGRKLAWVKSSGKWGIIEINKQNGIELYDINGDNRISAADALVTGKYRLRTHFIFSGEVLAIRNKGDGD